MNFPPSCKKLQSAVVVRTWAVQSSADCVAPAPCRSRGVFFAPAPCPRLCQLSTGTGASVSTAADQYTDTRHWLKQSARVLQISLSIMVSDQRFSLRWNNYQSQLVRAFESLLDQEDLVDVTIGAEGRKLSAHKVLLSACSPYFRDLLKVSFVFES